MSKIVTDENQLNTEIDDLITEDYALEILGLKNPADFRKFSRSLMKLSKIVKKIENSNAEKLNKGNVAGKYDTAEKIGDEVDKKYDKTGGTISGNAVITGNEIVNGSISCNSIILNGYTITIE